MSKDEALKMAIELLGEFEKQYGKDDLLLPVGYYEKINACKEALEQPEGKEFFERGKEIAQWADIQPAQEPVAWIKEVGGYGIIDFAHFDEDGAYPVYTHPHQWQGLTDDEIHNVADTIDNIEYACEYINVIDFACAIEQALKEKNT